MASLLEPDDSFEIVASTVKCIYDQACRKCGGFRRMIIFMPKNGQVVRKVRIEHSQGDTPGYMWHRKNEQCQRHRDKRQVETPAPGRQASARSGPLDWHPMDWAKTGGSTMALDQARAVDGTGTSFHQGHWLSSPFLLAEALPPCACHRAWRERRRWLFADISRRERGAMPKVLRAHASCEIRLSECQSARAGP
ncbi:unnamed protein product [Symbiodinium sp. CCMP2592]|nr:unnamed protein product [Symbiodinium sp. CCMP2592]